MLPRKLKIIHLSSPGTDKTSDHYPSPDDDYYFVASWAGLIARRLKGFNPELDVEVWRAEPEAREKRARKVFGVKATIWPYRRPVVKNLLTFEMVRHLRKLTNEFHIILHYHDLYNFRFVLLFPLICSGAEVVLSHHGGVPLEEGSLKDKLTKRMYNRNRIAAATYLTSSTRDYLSKAKNHPPLEFLPVGADFHVFEPRNRTEAREILNLDRDKTYALYVGKFYRLKSVDLILDTYKSLKDKFNFSVIFVGGEENELNDLFEEVRASGCPYFGVQRWSDMPRFFNAADFYLHPVFNPEFGGVDVSWMESLACNKPVLTPQLAYLDFDYSDLGVLLEDRSQILMKTEWMINNFSSFMNCRNASRAHLDGGTAIMQRLLNIYERIYP